MEKTDLERIRFVLNLPEIRSGRFNTIYAHSTISAFKKGTKTILPQSEILKIIEQIDFLLKQLNNISNSKLEYTDKYLKLILDLSEIPFLNFQKLIRKTEALEKPHTSVLRWSYYNIERKYKQEPKGDLIKRFEPFFQQLNLEINLLASKLK